MCFNEKKGNACSQCGIRNYTTMKNTSNDQERLEMSKFCKNCNAHTIHKETK